MPIPSLLAFAPVLLERRVATVVAYGELPEEHLKEFRKTLDDHEKIRRQP